MPTPLTYGYPSYASTYTTGAEQSKSEEGRPSAGPQAPVTVEDMPAHWEWKFEFACKPVANVLQLGFTILCVLSLGQSDLKDVWRTSSLDSEGWRASKERLSSRNSAIVIVVSTPQSFQRRPLTYYSQGWIASQYIRRFRYHRPTCPHRAELHGDGAVHLHSAIIRPDFRRASRWLCNNLRPALRV